MGGVPYADQLIQKHDRLTKLLGIAGHPVVPSPREDRFRSKVAFVFGPAAGNRALVMGHYVRGSKKILHVDECPVHGDRGNRIAFALRDRLARAGVKAVGSQRGGILRHIIIRTTEDDQQAVAMLVVSHNDKSLRTPVRGLLASTDRPDGFFLNINDKPGPYMVGPETIRIDGHSHVKETGLGTSFLVSPTAFFQTNVGAARELLRLVMEGVTADKPADTKGLSPPSARILDLYSGSGLFALPLAKAGARVTIVEENRQAMKDAEANIGLNRIADAQVRRICARVEDALPRLVRDPWDAVVLDPPRQGCPPTVLASVFETIAPPRAVYVSCNPDALARELPVILKAGYRVLRLQAVDMFPHTDHIETVVVLGRG